MVSGIVIAILVIYITVIKVKNRINRKVDAKLIDSQRGLIESQRNMIEVLKQGKSVEQTRSYREHMNQLVQRAKSNLN